MKKYLWMLSAAGVIGALRVNIQGKYDTIFFLKWSQWQARIHSLFSPQFEISWKIYS